MNTATLIDTLSERTGIGRGNAEKVINGLVEVITDIIKSGDKVKIAGLGCFFARSRKGRIGVNPRTFGKIRIPPVRVARFKAESALKEAVRQQ